MFEQLSDRLTAAFATLRGRRRVTEADLEEALRAVRVALLEADVHFKVVRQLVASVRERAAGERVLESITGAQQVVKIVHDALVEMLGGAAAPLARAERPPTVILLVGLQGSGKTTTAAKLANLLRKQGRRPLLIAADALRPAAVLQLVTLGKQMAVPVAAVAPGDVARGVAEAIVAAASGGSDTVIVDSAGRLHVDGAMMAEVAAIAAAAAPHETLLVVDAMTGQDAVAVATGFAAHLPLSGLVLTKVDSDAHGGASLSIRATTGIPVKLLGVGEKLDALEIFHPDRLAGRILGMGDVLSLVEKAQERLDQKVAEEQARKLVGARFTLDDLYAQLQQLSRLGSLAEVLDLVPGMGALAKRLPDREPAERQLRRTKAMISSMTRAERTDPSLIDGSRRRRIAAGSGVTVADVNRLLKQFAEMQKVMKQVGAMAKTGRLSGIPRL